MSEITITSSRVEYGYVVVDVEPFETVATNGKRCVIDHFFDWVEDEGRYPRGRGRLILKSGELGAREMDLVWSTPAHVRDAIVEAGRAHTQARA